MDVGMEMWLLMCGCVHGGVGVDVWVWVCVWVYVIIVIIQGLDKSKKHPCYSKLCCLQYIDKHANLDTFRWEVSKCPCRCTVFPRN